MQAYVKSMIRFGSTGFKLPTFLDRSRSICGWIILSVVVCDDVLFVGVSLKLLGRAKVHWSVQKNDTTKDYRAEEIYIDEEVYVFGSRESILCVLWQLLLDYIMPLNFCRISEYQLQVVPPSF